MKEEAAAGATEERNGERTEKEAGAIQEGVAEKEPHGEGDAIGTGKLAGEAAEERKDDAANEDENMSNEL